MDLFDPRAVTQVSRTRGADRQQHLFVDVGMACGGLFLQQLDAVAQLGHQGHQLSHALVVGRAHAASFHGRLRPHSGIRPCFFGGRGSRLADRFSNARASLRRVSEGSMMSSTRPRAAETYGVENVSRYSCTSSAFLATGSSAAAISLRKTTPAAPWAPITAISAVGQANTRSAPRSLPHIARYAPP